MNVEQDRARVVYDCVVFLQGLIKEIGPGVDCLELFENGRIELFISEAVLNEIGDVLTRPDLQKRFPLLTQERYEMLLVGLKENATFLESVPATFSYDRDPKDEMYINLALAAGAVYMVTRDNDLLDLMKRKRYWKRYALMAGGFEHHFRRVIAGDIDSVRRRLSDVLEDFGYIVLGDTPIQAKRPRQKSIWVAMVLDYDTKLTIALKPISPASTLATFDYDIEQLFTKGEMQALEREAEAIIALATAAAPVEAFCPSCGAENTGNARFCRACGKPGARNALPSELEVMRLTALTSAAQIEVTLGLILCLLTLAVTLPMIFLAGSTKGVGFGWLLLALGELLGSYFLIFGMRRLHRALNPANPTSDAVWETTSALSRHERGALPPPPASIVEGTTELMTPQKAPSVVGPARDTDGME